MVEEIEARLADVERRLAALEGGPGSPEADPDVDPDVDHPDSRPTRFWALEGLRPQATGSGAVVYAGTVATGHGDLEWQYAHRVDDLLGEPGEPGPDEQVAGRLAALGHPARLAILAAAVRGHDRTADLADLLDLGTSGQVYHHVKALTAAGWLRGAGRGRVAVPPERVVPLLVVLGAAS